MKLRKLFFNTSFMIVLMGITAAIITVFGVMFKQDLWRILPLYISLVIAFLQSKVSRLAPLLGSCNSLLYGFVYFSYSLYASMLYAVLVSAPLQFITFMRWRKNAYQNTTYFRKLTTKQRVCFAGGFVALWVALYAVLATFHSAYLLLDNTATLFGIATTLLMMLAYIEFTYLLNINNLCVLVLYATMIPENPEQITYFVYAVYALLCSVIASVQARKSYAAQRSA